MIQLKSKKDIEKIRAASRLLAEVHSRLSALVVPGITTREIDAWIYRYITVNGGTPSFLGYMGFPASSCISINEQIIHGIPGSYIIAETDIVSVDIGVELDGYYSDAAQTLVMPGTSDEVKKMVDVTKESLYVGIYKAVAGNRVSHIGKAVSGHVAQYGYGVVREYCGHGVGFAQHEDPQIPNYPGGSSNHRLREGMVLAIEPMINLGKPAIKHLDDNWTVVTADGRPSAHWEHSVLVTERSVEILTEW